MNRSLLQIGALGLKYLRHGYGFRRQLGLYQSLYQGSQKEFEHWRRRAYESVNCYARSHVAYYKMMPKEGASRVSKSDVRGATGAFLAQPTWSPFVVRSKTSGTTGVGMTIYTTFHALSAQAAAWWLFRWLFGVEFGEPGLVVGGRRIPRASAMSGEWIFLPGLNQVYASCFSMHDLAIEELLVAAEAHKVTWVHGYPSSLLPIAEYILRTGRRVRACVKLVSTGSESISTNGRALLGSAFQAPVSEFYGQVENVCAMWRCPDGVLHDLGVTGRLELDDRESSGSYEIVGSGYWNKAMPLIGYRTGDIVSDLVDRCSCGFPYPVARVLEGRIDDYVLRRDDTRVGRLARLFTLVSGCDEAQLIQTGYGRFELRIGASGIVDRVAFQEALEGMLNESVELTVRVTGEFERTSGGKVKTVVRTF